MRIGRETNEKRGLDYDGHKREDYHRIYAAKACKLWYTNAGRIHSKVAPFGTISDFFEADQKRTIVLDGERLREDWLEEAMRNHVAPIVTPKEKVEQLRPMVIPPTVSQHNLRKVLSQMALRIEELNQRIIVLESGAKHE